LVFRRHPYHSFGCEINTRKQLARGVVQHQQRIQMLLENATVKLASVVSDALGAAAGRCG
jgi:hypothetical protein